MGEPVFRGGLRSMQLLRLAAGAGIVALLFIPTSLADGGPETTLSVFDGSYDTASNDYLADAGSIEGVTGSVRGTTVGSTLEPNEPDHGARDADGTAGNSVWYRWTAPATGDVFFTTEGSAVDTDFS